MLTQEEREVICSTCMERSTHPYLGVICWKTDKKPDFPDACPNYKPDNNTIENLRDGKNLNSIIQEQMENSKSQIEYNDKSSETSLPENILGIIILLLGLICFLTFFIKSLADFSYNDLSDAMFWEIRCFSLLFLILGFIGWALTKYLLQISKNLKGIKDLLRQTKNDTAQKN